MPTSACLVPAFPFSCLGHAPHFGGDVPRQGPAQAHASSTLRAAPGRGLPALRRLPPAQLLPREPPASPGLTKAPPELPGAAPSLTQRGSPARDRASSDGTSAPALAPSPGPRPSRLRDGPAGSPRPMPAPQGAGTAGAPLPPEQPGALARGRTARGNRQLGAERGEHRVPSPEPRARGRRPAPSPAAALPGPRAAGAEQRTPAAPGGSRWGSPVPEPPPHRLRVPGRPPVPAARAAGG